MDLLERYQGYLLWINYLATDDVIKGFSKSIFRKSDPNYF